MNIKGMWVLGVCLCISGCATTDWPWIDGTAGGKAYMPCPETVCKAEDAQKALSAATNYCVRIMDSYDNSRAMLGGSKIALSTVGALSGGGDSPSRRWVCIKGLGRRVRRHQRHAIEDG